jgi:hypothetical protein
MKAKNKKVKVRKSVKRTRKVVRENEWYGVLPLADHCYWPAIDYYIATR